MSRSVFLTILSTLLVLLASEASSGPIVKEYLRKRGQALKQDNKARLGSNQKLEDPREVKVNGIIMMYKSREYEEGVDSNGVHFAAAGHFFHTKPLIEASNVFKIIRLLPKGASLHQHAAAVPSVEWVARNLTYMDDLYVCVDGNNLTFHFFLNAPTDKCCANKNWTLVADLRASASSQEYVDNWFVRSMSMYTPQPEVDYPNIDEAWKAFEQKIVTIGGAVHYEPALRRHFYQTLQEHYDDNVMYIEERALLENVYSREQTPLTPIEILKVRKEVVQKFKNDHPDFWGVKYIYAPHRFHTPEQVSHMIKESVEMKQKFPDFFAGFDLVGQEGLGSPLLDFLPELLKGADLGIKYFFHAGETDWHGTKIDENLVDAILLNATRIGHAYALASHPYLADEVKRRGIAVESCPISNQVLKLVDDFRNHPVIPLMTEGFPLVIGNDDPGLWGASGLSYDWYIAFMAMAGAHADLRFLKQLALNSIEASVMSSSEKLLALQKWNTRWSKFLDNVIETYGYELSNHRHNKNKSNAE